VFKFELLRIGGRRSYLFTTLGIPVLAVLIVFGIQAYQDWQASRPPEETSAGEEDSKIEKIGYVDLSGLFGEPGLFSAGGLMTSYATEDEAHAAMDAGDVDTVYVISADYMDTGAIKRYADNFGMSSMAADSMFRSFLMNTLLKGVDRDLVIRLDSDILVQEHRVSAEDGAAIVKDEGTSFLLVYVFALLLGFSTFFGAGYLMQNVLEEKETKMVEIILSTIRPLPLLAAKVLAAGLLDSSRFCAVRSRCDLHPGATGYPGSGPGEHQHPAHDAGLVPVVLRACLSDVRRRVCFDRRAVASMKEGAADAVIVTLPAMCPSTSRPCSPSRRTRACRSS
jgi:ABC-type Na+ efflux pump permease subunit